MTDAEKFYLSALEMADVASDCLFADTASVEFSDMDEEVWNITAMSGSPSNSHPSEIEIISAGNVHSNHAESMTYTGFPSVEHGRQCSAGGASLLNAADAPRDERMELVQ